ncbi:MAG: hypothetical protein H6560_25580 [Lewinellaceae bacterium]|nr:hypothetical protein [Lewinellaceae bacterium]
MGYIPPLFKDCNLKQKSKDRKQDHFNIRLVTFTLMPISLPDTNAAPALRGYRTQFLYTLYRILAAGESEVVYPELQEDYSVKQKEVFTEVTQIKDLRAPLTLSDFKPKQADSFFNRCLSVMKMEEQAIFKIVSLGPLGKELADFQKGTDKSRISGKLVDKYGYEQTATDAFLQRLEIVHISEEALKQEVDEQLRSTLLGTNIQLGCEVLLYWLYQLAEQQQPVTRLALIQKIGEVGAFINERHSFLKEYGRSILPLDSERGEAEKLQSQFLEGIAARYQHILAGLDIPRPAKMEALSQAFSRHDVVILHGASGQGKSTLAYRYMHERYPAAYAYQISTLTDQSHVLDVAQAIEALSRPFQHPFLLFVDVAPGDTYWVDLCKRLVEVPNCKILVGIREEELNRSASLEEFLEVGQVKLDFSREEAERLYDQYRLQVDIPHFYNFADAWSKFGGQGPLLEFAYLLRKGERLRDRLRNQLDRIQEQAIQESDLDQVKLLKYVAVAGAHDCRLDLKKLLNSLQLNTPQRSIAFFQEEYLLRSSGDGRYLEALHPVRARLMMELLSDPVIEPVEDWLAASLPFTIEEDWGNFVLQYAYQFSWPEQMMQALLKQQPTRWQTCQELLTGLIWCGVQGYIHDNSATLDKLKTDFSDELPLFMMQYLAQSDDFSFIEQLIGEEKSKKINALLSPLAPLDTFYDLARKWLTEFVMPGSIDIQSARELSALGYSLFWLGHFKIGRKIPAGIIAGLQETEAENVLLDNLADLLLGLQYGNEECRKAAAQILPDFLREFQASGKIPWIEDDGEKVKLHFFFNFGENNEEEADLFQGKSMRLLRLIRKAIPFREAYGSQGYGHQFQDFSLPYDESFKNITAKHLPLPWLTDANGIYLNLLNWEKRRVDWLALMQDLLNIQNDIYKAIQATNKGLLRIVKKNNLAKAFTIIPEISPPSGILYLPQEAVDQWGFTGDFNEEARSVGGKGVLSDAERVPVWILQPELKQSFKAIKDFHTDIRNFLGQAYKSLALKEASHGWSKKDWKEKEAWLKESGYPKDVMRLSKYNLTRACGHYATYQQALKTLFKQQASTTTREDILDFTNEMEQLHLTWPFFLDMELKKQADLLRISKRKEDAIIDEFEQKLEYRLNRLKGGGFIENGEFFSSPGDERVWYIILYVNRWEQALKCQDQIKSLLFECLEPAPYNSFRRIILEKHISRFWIVPLCGDFLITRNTLNFDLYHLLNLTEEDFRITMFGQLADEMIEELEVREASKVYTSFGNPERFTGLVQAVKIILHQLTQLQPLFGHSEAGDILVEVQVRKMILECYEHLKETADLTDHLLSDVKAELDAEEPFIPETSMLEHVSVILKQFNQVEGMIDRLAEDSFDPNIFEVTDQISNELHAQSGNLNIAYWSWLEIMINRFLQPNKNES